MNIKAITEIAKRRDWDVSFSQQKDDRTGENIVYIDFIKSFGPPLGSITVTGELRGDDSDNLFVDIIDTFTKTTPEIIISEWLENNPAPEPDVYRDVYDEACEARSSFWSIIRDLYLAIDDENPKGKQSR